LLIARLTAQLRCYVPEPVDETWGRLRSPLITGRDDVPLGTAGARRPAAAADCTGVQRNGHLGPASVEA
jgi:hypothetical protein